MNKTTVCCVTVEASLGFKTCGVTCNNFFSKMVILTLVFFQKLLAYVPHWPPDVLIQRVTLVFRTPTTSMFFFFECFITLYVWISLVFFQGQKLHNNVHLTIIPFIRSAKVSNVYFSITIHT